MVEVDVQFPSVVSPRSKLEFADLDVEGEIFDVDGAGRSKDGRRKPQHVSFVIDNRHCLAVLFQTSIGTAAATKAVHLTVKGLHGDKHNVPISNHKIVI